MKFVLIIVFSCFLATDVFSQFEYDHKKTTQSVIELYVTNYGVIGHNPTTSKSGLIYPGGTNNQYLFGSGIWFGTMKRVNNELRKLVTLTYNPMRASSWMYPGNAGDPTPLSSGEMISKYYVERSTDFTKDGKNKQNGMPNWSLWKTNESDVEGIYVPSTSERNSTLFPYGVAMKSSEMLHTRYRDDNLSRYEGGEDFRKSQGYPLGLQFDEKIYIWSQLLNNSSIIVQQSITNTSKDTLFDSYIANIFDPDIGLLNKIITGLNDNIRNITTTDKEGLITKGIYAWSGTDKGELGSGLDYLVISHLETPAVNNDSLRSIKYSNKAAPLFEQIGTSSVRMYTQEDDKNTDYEHYELISGSNYDSELKNSDIRALLSTGPFTLLPGQTARVAYCIAIVEPKNGNEAIGSLEDSTTIGDVITAMRQKYQDELLTSISENKIENTTFTLSPNPITDEFSMQYMSENGGEIKIGLFDLTGLKITDLYTGMTNTGLNNYNFNINNYNLASGLYTLQIESFGSITTQKVIIIK